MNEQQAKIDKLETAIEMETGKIYWLMTDIEMEQLKKKRSQKQAAKMRVKQRQAEENVKEIFNELLQFVP